MGNTKFDYYQVLTGEAAGKPECVRVIRAKVKKITYEIGVQYAPLPPERLLSWQMGMKKLWDFLEEQERLHPTGGNNELDRGTENTEMCTAPA